MNIKEIQVVYDKNKELDKMFYQEYGNSQEIIDKNKLELLVELGELANETRWFKYWSVKKTDRDKILSSLVKDVQEIKENMVTQKEYHEEMYSIREELHAIKEEQERQRFNMA